MTAPLDFFTGAPVAQTKCATAGFAYRINPAAQTRATADVLWRISSKLGLSNLGKSPASQFTLQRRKEAS